MYYGLVHLCICDTTVYFFYILYCAYMYLLPANPNTTHIVRGSTHRKIPNERSKQQFNVVDVYSIMIYLFRCKVKHFCFYISLNALHTIKPGLNIKEHFATLPIATLFWLASEQGLKIGFGCFASTRHLEINSHWVLQKIHEKPIPSIMAGMAC